MTLSMNNLVEKKASFSVDAEVPEPEAKVAKAPGQSKTQGDDTAPMQGSSAKKVSSEMYNEKHGNGAAKNSMKNSMKPKMSEEPADSSDKDDEEKNSSKNDKTSKMASGNGKDHGDKVPVMQGSSKIKESSEISHDDLDLSEDLNAMFEGSDLSEETQNKIKTIFETAVVSKINEKLAELSEKMAEENKSAQEKISDDLTVKMDQYLDHVVEHWLEDNKLAVESGLKTQLTEEFLVGLKNLFTEHYIDIPEEKVNVVEELAARVSDLEEKLNSQIDENVNLKQKINEFERDVTFVEVTEGLTETQIAKLESLSESINADSVDSYKSKLQTLRQNYFPVTTASSEISLDDEPVEVDEEGEPKQVSPAMSSYVSAISRIIKK